jgi:HSP20 family protein
MPDDFIHILHALFLPAVKDYQEPLWHPAADIYRTADGWLVKFELAGVRLGDLTLEVRGNRLIVRGCRRDRATTAGHRHYHMEISYNCFERCVELPCDLGSAHIAPEYRDGMLLVYVHSEN